QLTLGGLLDGWPALQLIKHVTEPALYTFDRDELVSWLRSQPDSADRVFIIGHNPALTDLINWLDTDAALDNLPTAGFARLRLDIDAWSALAGACGTLLDTLFPRNLDQRPC
ncbi:MAG: phosphoglycerate mutase, partial [Halieaceae bacterium]|nr:phosphoglycerate mutase [Halieaceae bacterium]